MAKLVDRDTLRATLNPILQGLPPEERRIARAGVEAALKSADPVDGDPREGETRALLRNVGPGYTALPEAECNVMKELVSACSSLLTKGPSIGLVGELIALLFSIRRHGVALTIPQGLVLGVLRKSATALKPDQIADALTRQRVGMTDPEVETALAELTARLNKAGRSAVIVRDGDRWSSVGV